MLACIVLERQGVSLHASASVSTLRFINNGPQSLFIALRGTYSHARMWTWVTGLFCCTTLLLQFSSTALVADLGIGILTGSAQHDSTLMAVSHQNINLTAMMLVNQIPYWEEAMQSFPTFGEYQENPPDAGSGNTLRDTGLTLRAFVPFGNSSARTSIKSFAGAATVLDSRVVCVRPKAHAGLSIGLTENEGWVLNGTLIPDALPVGLILPEEPAVTQDLERRKFTLDAGSTDNASEAYLNWSQQLPFTHDAGEWNVFQKQMYRGPALVSSLDPRYTDILSSNNKSDFLLTGPPNIYRPYGLVYTRPTDNFRLMTGRSYQILNITAVQNVPMINDTVPNGPKNFFFSIDQDLNKLVVQPQDEWLKLTIPRVPGWHVSISLCYDSFVSTDANVTLSADRFSTEPNLTPWDVENGFGTKAVLQQLGVLNSSKQNYADRGILRLQTTPQQIRAQLRTLYDESKRQNLSEISFPNQNLLQSNSRNDDLFGNFLCEACGPHFISPNSDIPGVFYQLNNHLHNQFFQDVIRTTNNSALACQAYFTNIGRIAYYDMLPYFDVRDSPLISSFQSAQFPRSPRGLVAVLLVLCVHLILVGLITVIFFTYTKVSRLGDNAWQSLAQAHSDETEEVLCSATSMKDGEVKELLKGKGLGKETVRLEAGGEASAPRVGLKVQISPCKEDQLLYSSP